MRRGPESTQQGTRDQRISGDCKVKNPEPEKKLRVHGELKRREKGHPAEQDWEKEGRNRKKPYLSRKWGAVLLAQMQGVRTCPRALYTQKGARDVRCPSWGSGVAPLGQITLYLLKWVWNFLQWK